MTERLLGNWQKVGLSWQPPGSFGGLAKQSYRHLGEGRLLNSVLLSKSSKEWWGPKTPTGNKRHPTFRLGGKLLRTHSCPKPKSKPTSTHHTPHTPTQLTRTYAPTHLHLRLRLPPTAYYAPFPNFLVDLKGKIRRLGTRQGRRHPRFPSKRPGVRRADLKF